MIPPYINRGFNLRRHESEYCPLQDHNLSIETDSDENAEMSTKRINADTDDIATERDLDNSDNTDDEQELGEDL